MSEETPTTEPIGISTTDGFRIELGDCGGFTIFAPGKVPFAWAQTLDEADVKIERERRERLHTRGGRKHAIHREEAICRDDKRAGA